MPRANIFAIFGVIVLAILISGCITVEDFPVACVNSSSSLNQTANQTATQSSNQPSNQTLGSTIEDQQKSSEIPPGPVDSPTTDRDSPTTDRSTPSMTIPKTPKPPTSLPPTPTLSSDTPQVPIVPSPRSSIYNETLRVSPVKRVREGDLVTFPNLSAIDLDGDKLDYTFGEPLDSKGRWLTKKGDAGTYTAQINVSDGKSITSQTVNIIVEPLNRPPILTPIKPISVNEGQTIVLTPKVIDPDRDSTTITYSGWQQQFPYKTGFDDQGIHMITITASDGATNTTQDLTITVINVNREPTIKALPDSTIQEGDRLTVKPTAIDPDNDPLTITYSKPLSKEGRWETRRGDAGKYVAVVTASDGTATTSTRFTITVTKQNLPPILSGVQDITVNEGQTITLSIQATDPENEPVRISYSGFMISPTKSFGYEDQGTHTVSVTATDGVSTIVEPFTITVRDVNRAPVFNPEAFK